MNFQHTEERRMLADSLERFIADQYSFEQRRKLLNSPTGFSREIWHQLADLGVLAMLFNENDGGLGGSGFDLTVVFEALGRGLVLEPFLPSAVLAGSLLAAAGSVNDAHRHVLDQLISAERIASLAHYEPDGAYQLSRVDSRAERHSDGWLLSGVKTQVLNGDQADYLLLSARTAGMADQPAGISLFLVPADTAGLQCHPYRIVDGSRAAEFRFEAMLLPHSALIGWPDQAYPLLEQAVARAMVALCAEALGAMEVAKQASLEYLRTRQQFGVPIGQFQALQHRMADLLLEVEQARSAVINAAAALDGERQGRELAVAAAKFSIGRIATLVAEESIQLHGGIGMTDELPLSHYAKRLIMIDHLFGDQDYHLQRYIELKRGLCAASAKAASYASA